MLEYPSFFVYAITLKYWFVQNMAKYNYDLEQADEKRKDKLDSWLADLSQPFNFYSCHPSIIKVKRY